MSRHHMSFPHALLHEAWMDDGIRFGKALTNILRDIPEDLRFGRYIPRPRLRPLA